MELLEGLAVSLLVKYLWHKYEGWRSVPPPPVAVQAVEASQSVQIPAWVTNTPEECFVGISKPCYSIEEARQQAIDVSGIKQKGQAENFLSSTLRSLFAVVENYPNLKADKQMLSLQEQLTSTENKISFSRNNYNDWVTNLNKAVEQFPTNIIAQTFGFKKEELFEIEDAAAREAPKVKF